MTRKKSQFLDGFSSDSGASSDGGDDFHGMTRDEREEAELMNGYGRKRKRTGKAKEQDIYGDFAEEENGDAEARGKVRSHKQANYLRGQAFVPASAKTPEVPTSDRSYSSSRGTDTAEEEESEDEEMQEEDETDVRPAIGGIGSSSRGEFTPASFISSRGGIGMRKSGDATEAEEGNHPSTNREGNGSQQTLDEESTSMPGIGSSRGGIGSSRGGIGTSYTSAVSEDRPKFPTFAPSTLQTAGVPSSFGSSSSSVEPSNAFSQKEKRPKRSFLPGAESSAIPKTSIKFGGGLGGGFNPAAYLASMGWSGGGLGENGEGMLNPIEVQLRPERAGIAFGGRKERTKQAKEEAKRRGEEVSTDEEERAERRNKSRVEKRKEKKAQATELRQAWTTKEKRPRKPRVEHRTYEQIIEEAGGVLPVTDSSVGQIIDARSREMKEVASIASALAEHAVPTSDSTRLPELRHNLRLIADNSKQTLDALAKEGAGIFERRRWLQREHDESERRREREAVDLSRLKVILSLVQEVEATGKQTLANTGLGLEAFEPLAQRLQEESDEDIERFGLDEAFSGALAPLVKRIFASWEPLQDAGGIAPTFVRWRRALRALGGASSSSDSRAMDRYGHLSEGRQASKGTVETLMLPFESLLWHLWMPRIRSTLNNDWKAHHPRAAVALLTTWQPLLPRYLWDNVLDQILLPKVKKVVQDWEPRTARAPLHHILFPWLPLLGDRLEETMAEARRRIRSTLKGWKARDEKIPEHLDRWREFFPRNEWDSMFLTQVVPKLSSHLADNLTVNPRSQDMAPLEKVLAWRELLRGSVLSRLLESEFFPKWLTTLHTWLMQPGVDLGEVAKWYTFWKTWFPSEVASLPGMEAGFAKGIALINQAVEMGDDRGKLPTPDLTPMSRSKRSSDKAARTRERSTHGLASLTSRQLEDDDEETVSFRSIVEERAAEVDLLVLPLNRSHTSTGLPLFRVSSSLDAKAGGAVFYIEEDIIWVQQRHRDQEAARSEWVPIGVEELMSRATGGKKK